MPTPDTTNYMIMGYVVFTVVMTLYLISLYVRHRNLKADMALLDELEKKE